MSKKNIPRTTPDYLEEYDVEEVQPDSLILKAGEHIIGVFMGTDIIKDNEGRERECFVLRADDDGLLYHVPDATVLKRKLSNIDEGTLICITRKEDVISKSDHTVKMFYVAKLKQRK